MFLRPQPIYAIHSTPQEKPVTNPSSATSTSFDMDFDQAFASPEQEILPPEAENLHFGHSSVQHQHIQAQQPVSQAAPQPHQQIQAQSHAPAQPMRVVSAHSIADIDLGIDIPGVVVGNVGVVVTRFPVERIKFTAQKKERISVILDQVIVCKTHWHDDIGSIICNGGLCCDQFGMPSVRYIFPILHYEGTDKIGKLISSDFSVKIMVLSSEVYKELLTIVENKGNLSQFDLIATCSDEKWQKISFIEVGDGRWKASEKVREVVADTLRRHGKRLIAAVGQSMTDEQLAKKLGVDVAPGFAEQADVDFDQVFA